jgi:hypothetical protein
MTPVTKTLIASALAALALAAPAARADYYGGYAHPTAPIGAPVATPVVSAPVGYAVQPASFRGYDVEWRELREARERFYARRHNRGERNRFERWYSERAAELRNRYHPRPRYERW